MTFRVQGYNLWIPELFTWSLCNEQVCYKKVGPEIPGPNHR